MKKFDLREMLVAKKRIPAIQQSWASVAFLVSALPLTVLNANAPPVITQGAGPLAISMTEGTTALLNPGSKIWDKRFGGSQNEGCSGVTATSDGGYLLVGYSDSNAGGDKSEAGRGSNDFWAVKINASGAKVWDKRFGGSGNDVCQSVVATSDGGYLLAGYSDSNAGGDKSEAGRGSNDYWAVKIDANGSKVWDKRFGGSESELCYDVVATSDGGFLLAGYSESGADGDKSEASRGINDFWVVKIDANGNKVWDKRFGGSSREYCHSVTAAPDGGCLLAGYSGSGADGDKSEGRRGQPYDYWIMKIDTNGAKVWDKRFGSDSADYFSSVIGTTGSGYLLVGSSYSGLSHDKSEASRGGPDMWAVKIDENGNKVWDKRFGGSEDDRCHSVTATTDGGYLLAGWSPSPANGDKSEGSRGSNDYWAVKIDANGSKVWDKRFGGSETERCYDVVATSDGGFLLAGLSYSPANGDKSETSRGGGDMWVVKATSGLTATDADTAAGSLTWSVAANAANGTAVASGNGAFPATISYTPDGNFSGSDSFVVQVTDGASLTDTITVNVTVSGVNDAPVITQGAGPLSVTMSEDGSPTAWSAPTLGATDVETADSALVWSVSSAASSGTATVSGTAAAPTTFTYAPNADFSGSDSFVVQVSDGALTDTITINVTVSGVSDAPVITQGAGPLAVTMSEDGSPTAWSAPTLGATDAETANSALVWSVSSAASNGTATVSGTAAAPTTFTYVPNADFNGNDSFVVQVSDGVLTDTITVNVTISGVNDPVFTSLDGNTTAAVSHPENVLSVVTLTATDDDNQSLTYSISGGTDSGLFEINATTNALQFIAHPDYEYPHDSNGDNAYAVTVIVSDGNLTDAQEVTVNVTDANDTYWTFTNAAATGRTGPTQSQVNAAYAGTTLEGNVTINTQGIQEWTVPQPGVYRIEARGAQGGNNAWYTGGKGARMRGGFDLNSGGIIKVVVGQLGSSSSSTYKAGGGGGSFIWIDGGGLLIAAGAGGGGGRAASNNTNTDAHGVTGAAGKDGQDQYNPSSYPGGSGGANGNGGQQGAGGSGQGSTGGGAGWLSSGTGQYPGQTKYVFTGGAGNTQGGFGGGGGTNSSGAGGGGGYSGGGGSGWDGGTPNSNAPGGGGGSYNSGSNQYNIGGYNSGHGLVVITFVEPTNLAPTDLSLSSASVAENSSAGATVGSFSATDPDDNGTSVYSHSLVDGNGSTDNASFTLEANGTLKTAAVFDYETKASYAVRVSVADEYNATYEEAFTISVTDVDDTAPVITLLGNATVTHEAAVPYSDAGATWTDAVDGSGTAVLSGSVNVSVPGVYVLTYSKSDVAGNAATQVTRTVTVQDTTVPAITLSGSSMVTHEAATAYSDAGANWTDTLDGSDSASVNGSVNVNVPGVYTLTYDFNDTAGNAATQITRTVTVEDTTVPVITLTGSSSVTHEAATVYSDAGATWADTLDGNGSVSATGSVNVNVPGVYTLTYDLNDTAGNAATQVTRTVTVEDTTVPVITLIGSSAVTHEAATAYSDAGATWADTLDGNGSISANGSVNVSVPGVYTLTYSKSDAAGNAATQVTRRVTVEDTTIPVITLTGSSSLTHEAATAYSDAGATWTDTLDANGSISANGSVNVSVPGVYTLTYSKSDTAGNAATQVTRTVTVQDTTPPVITLNGESNASHEAGAPYVELGAVWTDALDGNGSASVSGSVDANLTGVYLLNYSHTDVAGNSAEEVTRSVTVFNLSPLGVELSGLSLEEGLSSATAIGSFSVPVNPDSNVSKSHTFALVEGSGSEGNANFSIDQAGRLLSGVSFDYESQVSFSIRVRATDQFGGEAEETFTISVVDAFEPIVDTQPADGVDAGAPTLRGEVADLGHSGGIVGHGFLLGTTPDLKLGNPDVSNLSATSNGTSFSVAAHELIAGKTYYYKAYATNVEGTGYGAQERFTAAEQANGPSWAGAVASPDAADWWTSPWFGSFFLSSNGWLRHEKLGWLFAIDEGAGGVWLWQENLGWLWTGEGIYPYLFLNAENGWGFLLGDTENRLFIYRFSDSTWLDVAEGAEQQ